jgi:hypothetical protein
MTFRKLSSSKIEMMKLKFKLFLNVKESADYARRAHSPSLNCRIWRYIPPRDILVPRLKTLFNGYRKVICTAQTGRAKYFFSKEAQEMSERLLDTAGQGFLSDPPGIPLFITMFASDSDRTNNNHSLISSTTFCDFQGL